MDLKKIVFIFVFICIIFFSIFYYKNKNLGNNKNINQKEIVDHISKYIQNYEANIDVKIISNKNENYYKMIQNVDKTVSKYIINSPEILEGMTIELSNNKLKITNTQINMEKIYDNYEAFLNNHLFLNTFIEDYKNNESKMYEQNDEIILETKLNNNSNTYIKYKELHLNKKDGLPKEMIIKDNTKRACICIIYNDIKIK